MIVGFFLVMVTIMPDGEVTGDVMDHFQSGIDCMNAVEYEFEHMANRTAFVCVPDFVETE